MSLETAAKWCGKAAAQGVAEAQNNLASAFDQGLGVELNYETAVHLSGETVTGVARFVIKSVARFVSKSVARSSRLSAWSCSSITFFQKTVLPNPENHDATVGFGPNLQAGLEVC